MLSIALFGVAFAGCYLDDVIDPEGACVYDANKFSTLDADSSSAIPINLTIEIKGAQHTDADKKNHSATAGALTDMTDTEDRYILACPQGVPHATEKTVKFVVTRPAEYTNFGGEWVQLFPKDSWENKTNEYEPYTFNEYGAKIPLPELRATSTGLADDAPEIGNVTFFMEVKDEGDYEVKYGNPNMTNNYSNWVAVEFKSTLLRVGTPWADCSASTDSSLGTASYDVGIIAPILFGGPNVNSVALKAGEPSYLAVIDELANVDVPVKIVLEIYNEGTTTYTDSGTDLQCYKAGNACPGAHSVCKPEYCEIDVWKKLIADFKAQGTVTVLGSVDNSTTTSQYAGLGVDGYYFTGPRGVEEGYEGTSVVALGAPLFDEDVVDNATVYVTLAGSDLGIWNPFSWYPYVLPTKWAAIVTEKTDVSKAEDLFDRGYGWVYITSETGLDTKSTIFDDLIVAVKAKTLPGRRLQDSEARRLEASAPFWGCDDTLFECQPICMKKTGVVTTKVSNTRCAGTPLDQCSCKCYHEAQWACDGDAVVCMAKYGAGDLQKVGDKVCETRGAPKPSSAVELRIASTCTPVTEMRGSAPTAQCLAQWGTPEPTDEQTTTATNAPTAAAAKPSVAPLNLESFATTLALAAVALYA